jgi:alcohol dehydrogenase class IV
MLRRGPFLLENRKFVCPEFIFGAGSRELVGQYATNLGGHTVFVATDPGVEKSGWTSQVLQSLKQEGLDYHVFRAISPNPRDYEVANGVREYMQHNCDLILAVGGGSVMDCAKGIGILAGNDGNILDYEGVDKIHLPIPPLICIPTTGGTSADVSQFAIILDTKRLVKIAIISKAIVPDIALIDPRVLLTMPPYLTACTGIDALVHAFEAYVSNAASYITDMHALEAIELLHSQLRVCITQPENIEARGHVMLGSLLAGLAFSNASLGCVHAMAHSLGGLLDLPHGECNAILLDHVVNYNYPSAPERYGDIARILKVADPSSPTALCKAIRDFKTSVGVKSTLHSVGVRPEHFPSLSRTSISDPCVLTNPRKPNLDDIESIFRSAL